MQIRIVEKHAYEPPTMYYVSRITKLQLGREMRIFRRPAVLIIIYLFPRVFFLIRQNIFFLPRDNNVLRLLRVVLFENCPFRRKINKRFCRVLT